MTEDAKPEETTRKKPQSAETWEEDQQERGYYYDDAHGFEIFKPEEDDEECDESEADPSA